MKHLLSCIVYGLIAIHLKNKFLVSLKNNTISISRYAPSFSSGKALILPFSLNDTEAIENKVKPKAIIYAKMPLA